MFNVFAEIEEMRRKMQEEIREQLIANQQMMDDNTDWDAKLSQVKRLFSYPFSMYLKSITESFI